MAQQTMSIIWKDRLDWPWYKQVQYVEIKNTRIRVTKWVS